MRFLHKNDQIYKTAATIGTVCGGKSDKTGRNKRHSPKAVPQCFAGNYIRGSISRTGWPTSVR